MKADRKRKKERKKKEEKKEDSLLFLSAHSTLTLWFDLLVWWRREEEKKKKRRRRRREWTPRGEEQTSSLHSFSDGWTTQLKLQPLFCSFFFLLPLSSFFSLCLIFHLLKREREKERNKQKEMGESSFFLLRSDTRHLSLSLSASSSLFLSFSSFFLSLLPRSGSRWWSLSTVLHTICRFYSSIFYTLPLLPLSSSSFFFLLSLLPKKKIME